MSYNTHEGEGRLEERLREVEVNFERQMRERGFEPAQVELIALPGPLARLYAEREELRADLEELVRTASGSDPVSTGKCTAGVFEADRLKPGD
ncbi:MAG: hypothetical protein H0U18_05940 [Pyrinomonadaceae bacterium]|nr:hypothetical protein [Pyrinomonadaceae bacterium]